MTRWIAGAVCVLASVVAAALPARGSCLSLASPELRELDAQAEAQPERAIHEAQERLAAATGSQPDALLRAELFAVLADAYTEQSQPDRAHAAIASGRAELRALPDSQDSGRLRLRLDLLDAQWMIADSHSETAVAVTSKLLVGMTGDTLERACTLSMRATAYDYLQQPDRAVADSLVAYRLAQNGNWTNARLEVAYTLARTFSSAGLYPQAERMIDEVIALATADERTSLLSTAEYERGILLVHARRFADARAALEQANVYAMQVGDRFGVAATNATLCWALLNEGNLDAADRICNTGDEDLARGHRADLQTLLIGYRARLDLERQRPAAALSKLNAILTPAIHALLPHYEPLFHWERARALVALHRYREANADLLRMHELEEAADGAQRNRQVAVLSAMIASEELTAANRQLRDRVVRQQEEAGRQLERDERWVILSVSAVTISVLLGYLLVMSRRHSRALRRQEIILRSAGTHAPDAFLLLDERRRVQFANRNLCGHGPVPAVGEPVGSALPAALLPMLTAAIDESFQRRSVISFPATFADMGGAPRHFEMCVVPAVEQERVIGGTLRSIDVTEQRQLEREVVDGASQERRRLSSELHEGLGQQLAGVLLLLGNASNAVRRGLPNALSLIEEIAGYVRQGIDLTRELARGLAPVHIGSGSLSGALHNLAQDAGRRLRIAVEYECQLEHAVLSDLAADHLYCICREAVTNSVVHGRCTRAKIVVSIESDVLTMTIEDDGRGLSDHSHASQGLGVKMMGYRTRLLGGAFKITAAPGGGTCVLVRVPLAEISVQLAAQVAS